MILTFSTRVSFYFNNNVGVKMFIISGYGYWVVGSDITDDYGWMKSEERGLLTPPRTGWQYADGTGTWPSDDTLQLIF